MTQMMEAALHSDYKSRADMHKELKAVCSALLDFSEFEVVPDAKYWHAYNDIIDSYGVQFLVPGCLLLRRDRSLAISRSGCLFPPLSS
ncbi:hypothetical protein D3C80_1875270 [compost metagenome]